MRVVFSMALLLAFIIGTIPAYAKEQTKNEREYFLEPMTVTANKREQDIQDISASVSLVGNDTIEDFHMESTYELYRAIPNIYMTKTGSSASVTTFTTVRGIVGGMATPDTPVLATYVDDVYYPFADMNLLDVERVEVLRGPQGVLYGRNTLGGVINIITKEPTNEYETRASIEYGSFNRRKMTGGVSGPIVDDALFFRVNGSYLASDNYFENTDGSGQRDTSISGYEDKDFNVKLMTDPFKDLTAALNFSMQNYWSDGYGEFAPLKDDNRRKKSTANFAGGTTLEGYTTSLRVGYDFNETSLVSVTSYKSDDRFNANDVDFTTADILELHLNRKSNTISQELRWQSNAEKSPLNWLIGGYGYYEKTDWGIKMPMNFGPGNVFEFTNDQEIKSNGWALFGQASYLFWDTLELTGGLRYDTINKKTEFEFFNPSAGGAGGGSASDTYNVWLPKVSLSYKATENASLYASVSKGFREGGYNIKQNIGEEYKPEYTWNYEVGVKSQWFDNRLMVNAAAFVIDWNDRQVEISNPTGFYIVNAGKSENRGIELEVTARPLEGLDLNGSIGYVQATYKDFRDKNNDYSGNKGIDSPGYTGRLAARYRFDNGLSITGSYTRIGEIYFDLNNKISQPAYDLVDVSIGYSWKQIELSVWAKNLFDEEYVTRAVADGATNSVWYGRAGAPRSLGVSFSVDF